MFSDIWLMNENSMVLENTSLFLDLDQAVPQISEFIEHYEHKDLLMVVLCQDALPVASQIARELRLNLIFSAVDTNTETTDFDYKLVKESGRDIPQDFIVRQEQNLRTNLRSVYTETYERITKTYPDKLIILVDQLTNIDAAFFQCLHQKYAHESGENSFSNPTMRQFIFLHAFKRQSGNEITHGFDIVIAHSFAELL